MDRKLQMWSYCYFILLVMVSCWKFSNSQPITTVQFELGFSHPANNSVLLMNAIGYNFSQFTGDPLACTTPLNPCCHTNPDRYGHWFYPNGTEVPIEGNGYSFYRYRRDSEIGEPGAALLNRRYGAMSPTGIYHCVIPDATKVNQFLYIGLYADSNTNDAQLDPIKFAVSSTSDQFVSFSLTCTSHDGPISTMRWERDGVPVSGSAIYPDLIDPETATYSNILRVMNRQTGVYTCTATDGEHTLSLTQSFTVKAANPPTDVSADLNTTAGPIIITWSPPASGGAEVTGYRIYYNLGCLSLDITVANTESRYEMGLNGLQPEDIMSVSIRAESALLPSELVTIRISTDPEILTTTSEELTMTTTTTSAVTTAGMRATEMMTTSDERNGMGTVTTNVNGMETAPETNPGNSIITTSDGGIIVSSTTAGPIGVVVDGLRPRAIKDDPLLIAAIVEGITIVILIIILIVTVVLLIHYRNRVHSMLRQTSQKIEPPSSPGLQSECGTQSTEKLFNQLQMTDV